MQIIKACEICGKEFTAGRKNAKFCSKECYKVGNCERTKQKQHEKGEEKRKNAEKMPIWKINEEARKMGLSYGQYKARIYREVTR